MKKILVSVLAVAAMVACSTEHTVVKVENNEAIGFDTFVDKTTRAEDITTTNIDNFGVYASVTNNSPEAASALILTNEKVSKNGDVWGYVNTQYWVPGNSYNFTAIAPFEGRHWTYTTGNLAQNGTIAFNNETAAGEQDLVFASAERANVAAGAQTKVGLTFSHLLSKVAFKFTNGYTEASNMTLEVYGIKINNAVAEAEVEVENGATGEWAQVGDTTFVREFGKQAAEAAILGATDAYTTEHHYLLPIAKEYEITFTIDLYQAGVKVGQYEHTITPDIAFAKGGNYNISATLNEKNTGDAAFEPIEFTVEGVNEWDETEVEVYDGYFIMDGDAFVESANGLASIAEQINNGDLPADTDIALEGDIDLSDLVLTRATTSNWTPIGTSEEPFTGTFDGKGYTIKNLTLVESEAKEGKAYVGFFGYAEDATIKNVTFENVYINIPCLDIDHSQGHIGAVAGSLEGNSTIENVTVKGDITVYTTQDANGASRVAVIAGGNAYGKVTMKDVHVIANEGSSLIANNNVGALAGQLQGKMYFENCSSNINVTANKFFAGGLVGIAAGDSYIKNCHTTGDVAVVAGREGRHNDEYRVGGIAGGWADGKTKVFTLEGCTYTGEVSGKNSDGTVAEPLDYAGYVGRGYTLSNCAGSKVIVNGDEYVQVYDTTYGVYYVNGAYEVNTAADLKALANDVNSGNDFFEGKTVVLTANVDLKGEEWSPIGSAYQDHGFMGNFDGKGFAIKNLAIKNIALGADGYAYAGLFGVTEGVDEDNQNYIKNLVIENVNINTNGHIVAAAIAYPYYTVVENVTVKGNVSIKGGDYTAGVLAYTRRCVDATNIAIEANGGSIEGNMTIGGVISDIQLNGGLTANYSNFKASGLTIKGVMHVGGISGIIGGQTLDGATVKNVNIVCDDNRKGIVAGSLGETSTIKNRVIENVTGATNIVGATFDYGSEVTNNGDVYTK